MIAFEQSTDLLSLVAYVFLLHFRYFTVSFMQFYNTTA